MDTHADTRNYMHSHKQTYAPYIEAHIHTLTDTHTNTCRLTDINTHTHRDTNIDMPHPRVYNCSMEPNQVPDQGPERVQRVLGAWRRAASLYCEVGDHELRNLCCTERIRRNFIGLNRVVIR